MNIRERHLSIVCFSVADRMAACLSAGMSYDPAEDACAGDVWAVFFCDGLDDLDRRVVGRCLYFDTEVQAKEFVARAHVGIPGDELAALFEAHQIPKERISAEKLRRRANE